MSNHIKAARILARAAAISLKVDKMLATATALLGDAPAKPAKTAPAKKVAAAAKKVAKTAPAKKVAKTAPAKKVAKGGPAKKTAPAKKVAAPAKKAKRVVQESDFPDV